MKEPANNTVIIDCNGGAWQRLDAGETEYDRWFAVGMLTPTNWAEVQMYRPFRAVIAVTS